MVAAQREGAVGHRELVAGRVLAVEERAEHVGVRRVAVLERDDDVLAAEIVTASPGMNTRNLTETVR